MKMIIHDHEAYPGIIGFAISLGSGVIALSTTAIPVLHALALLVTIVAGIFTIVWTGQRIRRESIDARAKIEAAKIVAHATVVAAALKDHMKERAQ
jgi:hypothetical protein